MHRGQAHRAPVALLVGRAPNLSFRTEDTPKKNNPKTRMQSGSVNHA